MNPCWLLHNPYTSVPGDTVRLGGGNVDNQNSTLRCVRDIARCDVLDGVHGHGRPIVSL